jgi:hypothetical protein
MKTIILIISLLIATYAVAQNKTVHQSSKVSVSISGTDSDYSYLAKFDEEKTSIIQNLVQKELGKPHTTTSTKSIWEGKGYEIVLSSGKITIEGDKKKLTKSFLEDLESLGEKISDALETPKTPKVPKTP